MRILFCFILTISLIACGTVPQVDVKQRWNKTLLNYSFVPLYPAREDVDIGDIRIHRIAQASQALDSRLISDALENRIVTSSIPSIDAVLPGLEAIRLGSLDVESVGLSGLLVKLLGTRVTSSGSLNISLEKLTTAEIADSKVAFPFKKYLNDRLAPDKIGSDTNFLWGVCTAAKAMDDPGFEDIGISIVTRVIRTGRISYFAGTEASNAPTQTTESAQQTAPQAVTLSEKTALKIKAQDFDKPIVIGVDALMIDPLQINKNLPDKCKDIQKFFETSQISKLRKRGSATSAPN